MGTTLQHGIFLPAEGERNCYAGLASNWTTLDGMIGGYSAHVANLTIHVTAADKEAWNAKLDASALASYYTKSEADTLLGAKADDTAVVHKAGNESIEGKTFLTSSYFYNTAEGSSTPSLYIRSNKAVIGESTGTNSDNSRISFSDKNNQLLNYIQFRKVSNGSSDITFYVGSKDANDNSISSSVTFFKAKDGSSVFRATVDNDVSLGNNSYKFKDVRTYQINGINPGALGLPNYQLRSDISAYITNLTGANNTFTPTADGFVFVRSDNATYLSIMDLPSGACQVSNANTADTLGVYFPVQKGRSVYIKIICTSLNIAYFIPSQGNI